MSLDTQIQALTNATTDLIGQVVGQKAALDGAVTNATAQAALATTQAQAALANANTAQAANTSTQALVAGTTSAATQAANARDQAIAAWQASTAPAEQLAAMSQSIHSGAVVDVFLYDTSSDSDGGAWRKRCKHTSWENEPLCPSTWRGQLANLAAAWNVAGAAVGDYYQNTTDGKFYMIGGTKAAPTQTEVFRGNSREFPALAAVMAEAGRVVIYDLTQPGAPMWMVFSPASGAGTSATFIGNSAAYAITSSVVAVNGALYVGSNGSSNSGVMGAIYLQGLRIADFIKDRAEVHKIAEGYSTPQRNGISASGLALRNQAYFFPITSADAGGNNYIVNYAINKIAATILPGAPVDPATGLPVPTVAIASAGGVSVIKHDGTVVNSSQTESTLQCAISGDWLFLSSRNGVSSPARLANLSNIANGFTPVLLPQQQQNSGGSGDETHVSAMRGTSYASRIRLLGASVSKVNPAMPGISLRAVISNAFNSGYMCGDVRGAWLADTVAETVTQSGEMIDYAVGVLGSTSVIRGTSTPTGSGFYKLETTELAGTSGVTVASLDGLLTPGKHYLVTLEVQSSSGPFSLHLRNSNAQNSGVEGTGTFVVTGVGTYQATYSPTGAQDTFTAFLSSSVTAVSATVRFSVRLAEPDRSVKNKGLVVNGTLTKAPVAPGAQLVAYSGFSATNYLEQPYNPDLDFGTGDFCVMGWFQTAHSGRIIVRERAADAFNRIVVDIANGASALRFFTTDTGGNVIATSTAVVNDAKPHFFTALRRNGVLELYVDNNTPITIASTHNVSNNTALLRVGESVNSSTPFHTGGMITMVRISATAPSADQIAQIYRDELVLFQPNAKCTIDGTSPAVTALAYDDSTDVLHVGTSWGRSEFVGLKRIASSATVSGAITCIAAGMGAHITGGATSGRYVQPALTLRDELRRREDARRAMGREEIPFDFDGIVSQTAFQLPIGYTVKGVYVAGVKKREGATKDWGRQFDGYRETVNFGVSPGATWIQITANRSI